MAVDCGKIKLGEKGKGKQFIILNVILRLLKRISRRKEVKGTIMLGNLIKILKNGGGENY